MNDLLPDYNFNFNELILFDQFQYMTLSPHKISLFDLRYPSLPKTEKVININYKELSVKKTITKILVIFYLINIKMIHLL